MKKPTQKQITAILEKHRKWINGEKGGKCADFSGLNLCHVNFQGIDLYRANFRFADLRWTNLQNTNCSCTCFDYADLRGAKMYKRDCGGASFVSANLWHATVESTNFHLAKFFKADLSGVNVSSAKNFFVPMACPIEGSFIGWKTAHGKIIKLQIPATAMRSSSTGRKCRCSEAIVLAIEEIDGTPSSLTTIASNFDSRFIYEIGKTVKVEDFNPNRFDECASGIHFFIDRKGAVRYI